MNDQSKPKPLTEEMPGFTQTESEQTPKPLTEDDPGFNLEEQEDKGLPPGTALTEEV